MTNPVFKIVPAFRVVIEGSEHQEYFEKFNDTIFGISEAAALERATRFYKNEVDKLTYSQRLGATPTRVISTNVGQSRGVGFAGKIWVINRTTHERKRVDASEVENLLANGWIKGGPRTKI